MVAVLQIQQASKPHQHTEDCGPHKGPLELSCIIQGPGEKKLDLGASKTNTIVVDFHF